MSDSAPSTLVVVEGSARVAEPDRAMYLKLVKAIIADSVLRPGCIKFAVAEDIGERNLFHLTELWTDMKSLDASRFGATNTEMLREFAPLDVRDRKVFIHHVASTEPG